MKQVLITATLGLLGALITSFVITLFLTQNAEYLLVGLILGSLAVVPMIISTTLFILTRKRGVATFIYWSIIVAWTLFLVSTADLNDPDKSTRNLMAFISFAVFLVSVPPAIVAYIILHIGFRKSAKPASA